MPAKAVQKIRYHLLYWKNLPSLALEPERFTGKSVLVVGPARTVQEDLDGLGGHYDIVVKMNNALFLPVVLEGEPSFRCDVLFHSLTRDMPAVTAEALDRAGVKCIVHRTPGRGQCLETLDARTRLCCSGRDIRIIPPPRYRALSWMLGGYSPTTGMVCLDFLLRARPKTLAVAGFTFFRTKYVAGYDDRDSHDTDSTDRVKALNHHDPSAERDLLRRLFDEAREAGKTTVLLGAGVQAALLAE